MNVLVAAPLLQIDQFGLQCRFLLSITLFSACLVHCLWNYVRMVSYPLYFR